MATSVNAAFNQFITNFVNLDPTHVSTARSSRDWLLEQIHGFGEDTDFPKLHAPYNIHYGSFSRKTKIRPLDDIDLMIGLHAQGATYLQFKDNVQIYVKGDSNLHPFCNKDTTVLNSRKVIEAFKGKLSAIPQYRNAEIKRNLEAVTLSLVSYDWVFDLVPCFKTSPDATGREYFQIPDGYGNWKMTNPLLDKENTSTINQQHQGKVLNLIRLIKYWNKHSSVPAASSYLIENLVLEYYKPEWNTPMDFPSIEFPKILQHLSTAILSDFQDPKGIQENINSLSIDERRKISTKAFEDNHSASIAIDYDKVGRIDDAIEVWKKIFGAEFPDYG